MAKFKIGWEISGEAEIEADTREAAQEQFDAMDVKDLAESGELFAGEPVTQEEIDSMYEGMKIPSPL